MRTKRPDRKNALSIVEAAERDMAFTLELSVNEASGTTIVRNIYESFRKLGDALLIGKGQVSEDHVAPIRELTGLAIKTERPLNLIDNMRRLRHNINYYGYRPKMEEVKDARLLAATLFAPIVEEVKRRLERQELAKRIGAAEKREGKWSPLKDS